MKNIVENLNLRSTCIKPSPRSHKISLTSEIKAKISVSDFESVFFTSESLRPLASLT